MELVCGGRSAPHRIRMLATWMADGLVNLAEVRYCGCVRGWGRTSAASKMTQMESTEPKRHGFQFSLRRLLVAIALLCVGPGGWVAYLKNRSAYHEREAQRLAGIIRQEQEMPQDILDSIVDLADPFDLPPVGSEVIAELPGPVIQQYRARIDENFRSYARHRELAARYRAASYRPWIVVPEPAPRK
jgi:hypothetical protein